MTKTYTATFVFGEHAVRHLDDPGITRAEIEDLGSVLTVGFDTEACLAAYIQGVDDAAGWLDACIVNLDDYPFLKEETNE